MAKAEHWKSEPDEHDYPAAAAASAPARALTRTRRSPVVWSISRLGRCPMPRPGPATEPGA